MKKKDNASRVLGGGGRSRIMKELEHCFTLQRSSSATWCLRRGKKNWPFNAEIRKKNEGEKIGFQEGKGRKHSLCATKKKKGDK